MEKNYNIQKTFVNKLNEETLRRWKKWDAAVPPAPVCVCVGGGVKRGGWDDCGDVSARRAAESQRRKPRQRCTDS